MKTSTILSLTYFATAIGFGVAAVALASPMLTIVSLAWTTLAVFQGWKS
jgi:hypothetical protein